MEIAAAIIAIAVVVLVWPLAKLVQKYSSIKLKFSILEELDKSSDKVKKLSKENLATYDAIMKW